MIKIIKKKRYDTAIATEVASASNGYGRNDFKHQEETLYLTESGSWFLHGEGGPLSDYAEHHGNHQTDGEDLRAMTSDEAYAWLEANQKVEAIDLHFADRVSNA